MQVRGKRTKAVPIVFKTNVHNYMKLLIKYRNNAKIFKENPYMFSNIHDVTNKFKFVSACALMNKFSDLCGAKNPERLRGTFFRHHIATKGMEKGINDQGVEKLSGYLGHTPKIHHQNYRQSVLERDVAVSNFVEQVQTNQKPSSSTNRHEVALENAVEEVETVKQLSENQFGSMEEHDESSENDQNENENDMKAANLVNPLGNI